MIERKLYEDPELAFIQHHPPARDIKGSNLAFNGSLVCEDEAILVAIPGVNAAVDTNLLRLFLLLPLEQILTIQIRIS